ncbi:putative aspartate--tRNA ligase [Rosa chinensis]|uniref:Putative aspartate--tRNA ligase n=1 Tax=Rosa chinensis TaxID=74649 RepID=A0A2P6QAC3_ROSCH|nr:putative aspartate--tRNA ligase [Rosa chinensis]
MAFTVVRKKGFTVQCVVTVQPEIVSRQTVKYVASLSGSSIIVIEGIRELKALHSRWRVQFRKLYCISKGAVLPFNIEDAARSEKPNEDGEQLVRVKQDKRLNYRALNLQTLANL